jgi:DNA repair exonuclease SbcCD ATPase subunit
VPPAAKQALILAWMQKSCVAHSIKDLEKALPSVASINGMQVKDYLQALSDDNKIRVEKIGSGNWYWSFVSEEKRAKENALAKAQEEKTNLEAIVSTLRRQIDEASAAREDDGGFGMDRASLTEQFTTASQNVETLKQELARYSQTDPEEIEKKRARIQELKSRAERSTEHIESIEGWMKEQTGGNSEALHGIRVTYYGDQYDAENDCLLELF